MAEEHLSSTAGESGAPSWPARARLDSACEYESAPPVGALQRCPAIADMTLIHGAAHDRIRTVFPLDASLVPDRRRPSLLDLVSRIVPSPAASNVAAPRPSKASLLLPVAKRTFASGCLI